MRNDSVQWLLGTQDVVANPMRPYSELVIDFLDELSSQLRKSVKPGEYPDIISLAFWCRKGNILKLKERALGIDSSLGKGLVFHITPSNVPVNFAFSFFFGLLSGNSNIVRVPSKDYAQVDIICGVINKIFENPKYNIIKKGTAFVKYGHEKEITDEFSLMADARIIWGGDESIKAIRKSPLKPKATEIVFADRYSFGMLSLKAVKEASDKELKTLAHNFYNDTYLMDQNACSTPHLMVWKKDVDFEEANVKKRFWDAIFEEAKTYDLEPIKVVDKYTDMCSVGMRGNIDLYELHKWENLLYVLELNQLPEDICTLRGRFGMFYDISIDDIQELASYITQKVQSVIYYGIEKEAIKDFVIDNGLTGIDRIVAFGKALDIGVFWDGYDIVGQLSRRISIY